MPKFFNVAHEATHAATIKSKKRALTDVMHETMHSETKSERIPILHEKIQASNLKYKKLIPVKPRAMRKPPAPK